MREGREVENALDWDGRRGNMGDGTKGGQVRVTTGVSSFSNFSTFVG